MMDIQPLWVCKISLSHHIGRDHKKKKKMLSYMAYWF